jgi:hypothetical protein
MSISVLIIGAGGAFEQLLLQEFINQKESLKTIAILISNMQKASRFAWVQEEGVQIFIGSFLDLKPYSGTESKPTIFLIPLTITGFTYVISVVGNPILRLLPTIIEAAISARVTHFYPSEWNSDISARAIYSMRYCRDKQATRSQLAAVAKMHPDFRYTLFVTGIFTE